MKLVGIIFLCCSLVSSVFAMESPSTDYDEFDDCRVVGNGVGDTCDEYDAGRQATNISPEQETKRDPTDEELYQWFDAALHGNIDLFEHLLHETTLGDSPSPEKNFHVDVGSAAAVTTGCRQATALSYALNDPHSVFKGLYPTTRFDFTDSRYLAIYKNKIKIALCLLDKGADPNRCLFYHDEITPLHVVLFCFEISSQSLLLLERLLPLVANPNVAIRLPYPFFTEALQAYGDFDGYTPLMLYAYMLCYAPRFDESFLFGEILRFGDLLWDASRPEDREKAFKVACRVLPKDRATVRQAFGFARDTVEAEKCCERNINPLLVADWAQKLGLDDLHANLKPRKHFYGRYQLPSIEAVYYDVVTGWVVGCEVVHQNGKGKD